ncbi:cutinase family protein [Gordonia sp. CPCC 206044]|uniref:cutinase family protein n=1 Tax=Gordonia sp. CPCC 206044 TaxID=3140793 RepID=UPI003AF36B16
MAIVMMAGTGETSEAANSNVPVGMLKGVTDRVKAAVGGQVSIIFPGYSASAFNKGKTYVESKESGKQALKAALQRLDPSTKVVFGGYSQGADIAGDVASDIGNNRGPITADRILGVALLADPGRGTTGEALVGPNTSPGVGMGGDRPGGMGALAGRVATICDTGKGGSPGDMYCNLDRKKYPLVANISQMLAMTPAEAKTKGAEDQKLGGLPGTVGQSGVKGQNVCMEPRISGG